MSIEPWAVARQQVETLLIEAGHSRAAADLSAAQRALIQFKVDYPHKVYTVAALTQALDEIERSRTRGFV